MSSPTDELPDLREKELVEAQSVVAREALRALTARTARIAQQNPEVVSDELRSSLSATTAPRQYNVRIQVGGFFGVLCDVYFTDYNNAFHGSGGGLVVGGGITWGTAWFNYSIDKLVGWNARFEGTILYVSSVLNFFGMHGEVIGTMAGGGISDGIGILAGDGKFS
jgi:hypothetical protein